MPRETPVIPLFAENMAHSSAPLENHAAVARSGGQGRPQAGACLALDGREHDGIDLPSAGGDSPKELNEWIS